MPGPGSRARLYGPIKIAAVIAVGWIVFHFTSMALFYNIGPQDTALATPISIQRAVKMPDLTFVSRLTSIRHLYIASSGVRDYHGNFLFTVEISNTTDASTLESVIIHALQDWQSHIQLVVYHPQSMFRSASTRTGLAERVAKRLPRVTVTFTSPIPSPVPIYAVDGHISGAELWWYSDTKLPSQVRTSYVVFAPLNLLPTQAFLRSFWELKYKLLDPAKATTVWTVAAFSSPFLSTHDAPLTVSALASILDTDTLQQYAHVTALGLPGHAFDYTAFLNPVRSGKGEIVGVNGRRGLHPFYMFHTDIWPSLYQTALHDTSDDGYDGTNERLGGDAVVRVAQLPYGFLWTDTASAFTLAVHCSVDKYKVIGQMAARWRGPIAVAFYVQAEGDALEIEYLSVEYPNLKYVLLREDQSRYPSKYPVNILRNMALDLVRTEFSFLVDADFVTSRGIEEYLTSQLEQLRSRRDSLALVIPCFTTNSPQVPYTFADLLSQVEQGLAFPCGMDPYKDIQNPHAHVWGTNYTRWYNATVSYPVGKYYRAFEPYVVVSTTCSPRYHPSFIWYGDDKVVYQEHLHRLNYTWQVEPHHFVVHIPHAKADWAGKERDWHYEAIKDAWKAWEDEVGPTPPRLCDDDGRPTKNNPNQIDLQAISVSDFKQAIAMVGVLLVGGVVMGVCIIIAFGRRRLSPRQRREDIP